MKYVYGLTTSAHGHHVGQLPVAAFLCAHVERGCYVDPMHGCGCADGHGES